MSEVRCGIIGCGAMGSWHAGNLASQADVNVVAVADVIAEAASSLASAVDARVCDAMELIDDADVNAVLIASSDDTHAKFAIAAIAAGKPVFLEKPLGSEIGHAQSVLDAEIAAEKRFVRVGFMRELDPAHVQVAESLRELGPITMVRCVHRNVDVERRDIEMLFAQSLIHDIHTIRWLTGAEILAVTVHVAKRTDGYRDMLLVAELDNGALGTIEFEDHGYAYEVHVEVTAEDGMVATLPHPRAVVRQDAAETSNVGTDWFGRFAEAYRIEIQEWADSVRDPTSEYLGPTVWDGYCCQVVADAGVQALTTGTRVDVHLPARPSLYRAFR